jgi:hypothetical protein
MKNAFLAPSVSDRIMTFLSRKPADDPAYPPGSGWAYDAIMYGGRLHNAPKSTIQTALKKLHDAGKLERIQRSENRVAYRISKGEKP